MGTIQQPKAKEAVQKDNLDSMLLLKITGMALLVAAAMAASCPFTADMGHGRGICLNLMTRPNGSCKKTKIARCVQCSGCKYYTEDDENQLDSRSYLNENPHCKRCRQHGKRTEINKKSDFSGRKLWKCLRSRFVPSTCFEEAEDELCKRIHDVDDRNTCHKFYQLDLTPNRSLEHALTCPPQVHHLIYVLHCLQIGPAICQSPNVLTKYSKCLSTCNDHAFVVQARGVYQHTVNSVCFPVILLNKLVI